MNFDLLCTKFATSCCLLTITAATAMAQTAVTDPLRVGIAGLTHAHVHGILRRGKDADIEVVGIAEANRELAERYLKQYSLSPELLYADLDEMLTAAKPEAVTAFNSIFGHLAVVETCAAGRSRHGRKTPRGEQ